MSDVEDVELSAVEHENLFADEAEEAADGQVEGEGTQMNATANLDVGGAGDKKKRVMNPQPKLNADRIMGPRGVQTLEDVFKDWKSKGPGHEFDDLDVIMHKMNHWAHRLYPKLPFDATLDILANRLGNKKVVTTHIKKIRMGMVNPVRTEDGGEDGNVARYDGEAGRDLHQPDEDVEPLRYNDEEADDFFSQPPRPLPASSQPMRSLNEEQMERMRRNKELAARRKREREEQRRREEEQEEQMRDMEQAMPVETIRERIGTQCNLGEGLQQPSRSPEKEKSSQTILPGGSEDSIAGPPTSEQGMDISSFQNDLESGNVRRPPSAEPLLNDETSAGGTLGAVGGTAAAASEWENPEDNKQAEMNSGKDMLSLDQMMEEMDED